MILTSGELARENQLHFMPCFRKLRMTPSILLLWKIPLSIKMEGINQIQVNPEVGLTFTTGLRSSASRPGRCNGR